MPVYPRLKNFEFATRDYPNSLVAFLKTCPDTCEIRLAMFDRTLDHFPNYEQVPQGIKSRITRLSRMDWRGTIEVDKQLRFNCDQFDRLSSLSIRLKDNTTTMPQLVTQLEPLGRTLIYLAIEFNFQNDDEDELVGLVPHSEAPVARLLSVRILVLSSDTVNHHHTDRSPLRIPEVFPNIEVAKVKDHWLYGFDCDRQCHSLFSPGMNEQCIFRQLQPFLQCASLKKVYYRDKPYSRDRLVQMSRMVNQSPTSTEDHHLDRLSITELLSINQDTQQWRDRQMAALRRRTEVTLLFGHSIAVMSQITDSPFESVHNPALIHQSSLSTRWLTQADITKLVATFDNIKTLRVYFNEYYSVGYSKQIRLIESLLNELKNKLTSVSIILEGKTNTLDGILASFNAMPNLTELNVEFPQTKVFSEDAVDPYIFPHFEPDLDLGIPAGHFNLQVLDRLSHFRFRSRDHPKKLFFSLQDYAVSNGRLQRIRLWIESGFVWFEEPHFQSLPVELRQIIIAHSADHVDDHDDPDE